MRRPLPLAVLMTAALLPAGPLVAHPHVFIDGGLGFELDAENRLTHLRVVWVFDAFYSLFFLTDYGMDPDNDGALTEEEGRRTAEIHSQWMEGYEGDSYAWQGETALALSGPMDADATLLPDGRIRMEFRRALAAPVAVEAGVIEAKAYDPTYYIYYAITEPPTVTGGAGCGAEHRPVALDGALASLQQSLFDYDPYSAPEDPNVGAKFADTLVLACD